MNSTDFMYRCIELAQKGLGSTYPNPLVGAVVVYNNKIIGEGWHQKAGDPHAEVHAIQSVKNKSLLHKSTLYVNLEPCSHTGKTPPCCDLIIKHNIPKVIIGTVDPFKEVQGRGIQRLISAGIDVQVGIAQKLCQNLNRRFFTYIKQKRPYVILKWTESIDGFIAPIKKEAKRPVWITSLASRQLVHQWRAEEQAILVGKNTVIEDNPFLNVRHWKGSNPLRIVIDPELQLSDDQNIFLGNQPTFILNKYTSYSQNNKTIIQSKLQPKDILHDIAQQQIQSLIIEGGRFTLQQFIEFDCWDEARIFIGPTKLGAGVKAPMLKDHHLIKNKHIGSDFLKLVKRN